MIWRLLVIVLVLVIVGMLERPEDYSMGNLTPEQMREVVARQYERSAADVVLAGR